MPSPIIWGITTQEAIHFYNCVESATGSTRCPSCDHRVWFPGSYPTGKTYLCPYCNSIEVAK